MECGLNHVTEHFWDGGQSFLKNSFPWQPLIWESGTHESYNFPGFHFE